MNLLTDYLNVLENNNSCFIYLEKFVFVAYSQKKPNLFFF